MTVELRLREKYLSHTVKKASKGKTGGNTGSSDKKRFKLPNATPRTAPRPARTRVLAVVDGRRSWTWKEE